MTASPNSQAAWARVIVVNYNGGALIQACLDALAAQSMTEFEVVIVDNASTDGSGDRLALPDHRFTLVRNAANVGFAAGNNLAARDCGCDWIATLNPDTVAHPDWLLEMRRGTQRHPAAAVFGATLVSLADADIVDGFGDVLSITGIAWRGGHGWRLPELPDEDCEILAPCAAAALYRRSVFEAAGGFDEAFFCYLEDVDLGLRARLLGARCVQLRRAIVRHGASAGDGSSRREFTVFYSFRNRLFLLFKNLPALLLPIAIPLNLLVSILMMLRRDGNAYAPAALRGIWHGVRGLGRVYRQRREVQATRRLSTLDVMGLLSWNPRDLLHTRWKVWPAAGS